MKFAAGLTVSGILGLIVLEALKLVLPTLAVWTVGLLMFLFKALLIGMGLILAACAIGLAIFLYKRSQRSRAEA